MRVASRSFPRSVDARSALMRFFAYDVSACLHVGVVLGGGRDTHEGIRIQIRLRYFCLSMQRIRFD